LLYGKDQKLLTAKVAKNGREVRKENQRSSRGLGQKT